jgi:hypothetical protein
MPICAKMAKIVDAMNLQTIEITVTSLRERLLSMQQLTMDEPMARRDARAR